jgi:hypothetical protein
MANSLTVSGRMSSTIVRDEQHFHTRAILIGRQYEGGRRCDKSKAKNADRASDTAHGTGF